MNNIRLGGLTANNLKWKAAVPLFVVVLIFFLLGSSVFAVEIVPFGEVDVTVYVISLDGVDGHGVGNMARMVEGILGASRVNATVSPLMMPFEWKFGEVEIDINVTVIHDWNDYEEIVEACSKAIIINAHGETVPVPSNHTKEEWVDKIAEAMAYRNVTWVHTAGYPFYYYYIQGYGEGEWGESGFQRLMSHIGKDNVTCNYPHSEAMIYDMNIGTGYALLLDWSSVSNAGRVQVGKPLHGSELNNSLILPIWGVKDGYMSGAVINFGQTTKPYSYGFYVHIGANQTYTSDTTPTDADYWRGYVGAAAAIWSCTWRFAAEDAISDAKDEIARAETEGRTKGLDEARQLLQRAENCVETQGESEISYPYIAGNPWGTAILRAMESENVAAEAVTPSFVEAYAIPLTITGMAGLATAVSLVMRWRKNSKKESETI